MVIDREEGGREGERERDGEKIVNCILVPSHELKEEDSEREDVFGGVKEEAEKAFSVIRDVCERSDEQRESAHTLSPAPLLLLTSFLQKA